MNKYLRITFVFAGIWMVASILNGILSGITIAIADAGSINEGMGTIMLSVFFSFFFSVPLLGMLWFITLLAMSADKKGVELFRMVLALALFAAIAGAAFYINSIGTEFESSRYFTGLCIIVSALSSVLLFRNQIKTNA